LTYRISAWASGQIVELLAYSQVRFGAVHQENYRLLLAAAMEDLAENPNRFGATPVPRASGIWSYDLRHSRLRLPRHQRVSDPWHKIVYSPQPDGVVEILAVVGRSYQSGRAMRAAL